MAGNVTWAETGITEHQLLEYYIALEDGRVAVAHGWQRHKAEIGMTGHQASREYTIALEDGRVAGRHGWQRHMAEYGMTEHQLLESIL
jgi:hypothetical protein